MKEIRRRGSDIQLIDIQYLLSQDAQHRPDKVQALYEIVLTPVHMF